MNEDFIEFVMNMNRIEAMEQYGPKAVVVLSEGAAGEYDNNPTIDKYYAMGYRLADANMFGHGDETMEVLIFIPKES
ncbi:MAG: hypothetical protein J6R48_07395 [Muribaculaceae bacterium]|nr:hypothetical protein [Muribaculaceae bacterium]